jgi:hypothetical protein
MAAHLCRTDRREHKLINFFVNSPARTYFLEFVDASIEAHDATMLADLLERRIVQITKENVVQVVMDNSANYKAADKLLMQRIPTLFWTPYAANSNIVLDSLCSSLFGSHVGRY